jgi:hypothetical protein
LVFQFGFCENLGFNRCGTTSLFHFGLAALIGARKKTDRHHDVNGRFRHVAHAGDNYCFTHWPRIDLLTCSQVPKIPQSAKQPTLYRHVSPKWPVPALRGSLNYHAPDYFFPLRAHAAKKKNSQVGLSAAIRCVII